MAYNFSVFKTASKNVVEWLTKEFATLRTGRATPAILDSVRVEAYGAMMPVNQLANISIEDARMMRITPWDNTVTKAIEKAIQTSDLGLSVAVDGASLRISFPELTSERRLGLVKMAKQKLEDAKVTLRGDREKTLKDMETQKASGVISEDELFRLKAELQKLVDEGNKALEDLFTKKEKEIAE